MKKFFFLALMAFLWLPATTWADDHEDHNSGDLGNGEVYDGEEEGTGENDGKIVPSSVQLQYHILTAPTGTAGQEGYVNGTVELDGIYSNVDNVGVISIPHEIQVVTVEGTSATVSLYTVTGIAANAFYDSATDTGNTVITSVTIPYTVTYIGASAFRNCSNLTSLAITDTSGTPSQLTTIGDYAFTHTIGLMGADNGLTSLDLPASLQSIGDYAFQRNSLASLKLSEGLISIGQYAFSDCDELESLVIPSSVQTISDYCFFICGGLTTISMSGATTLGASAFGNCQYLTSLVLDETASGGAEEDADPFAGDERDNITVYVPTGSAATYLASGWNTLVEADDELHWNFLTYSNGINSLSCDDEGTYYATYYTDAVGEFGSDVTPYIVTGAHESGAITEVELTGYIPGGTGVLLTAKASGDTYYYHPYGVDENSEGIASTTGNMLCGSIEGGTTTEPATSGYYYYKLTLNSDSEEGSVGFYWGAADGGAFSSGAYKAYLSVPTTEATGLSYYSFKNDEGDTTGISAVESASEAKTVKGIYTLQGVRVSDMSQKGVYIVDGKKVLVK